VALCGVLIPLVSYGFIIYRAFHPADFQWPLLEPSIESALGVILGADYGRFLGHFNPTPEQKQLLASYVYPFLIPSLAAFGGFAVWARSRPVSAFLWPLLAAAVLQILFILNYGIIDPDGYFLTPLMIGLLVVPAGAAALFARIPRAVLGMVTVALTLVLGIVWIPTALQTRDRCLRVDEILRERWHLITVEEGIVLWENDYYTHLKAYQLLEGDKPGLHVDNPNILTWDSAQLAFRRKFGFDPVAGLSLEQQSDVRWIPRNIDRQTDLPVIDFQNFRPWPPI
jgi:hypothetical protein